MVVPSSSPQQLFLSWMYLVLDVENTHHENQLDFTYSVRLFSLLPPSQTQTHFLRHQPNVLRKCMLRFNVCIRS